MDMIGIDLHKREGQLCTLGTDGNVTEQRIVKPLAHRNWRAIESAARAMSDVCRA
jgi:hypothetical protein